MEPLLIAQRILGTDCPAAVIGNIGASRDPISHGPHEHTIACANDWSDHTQWTLTTDDTIPGASKAEMLRIVPNRVNERNKFDWDSWGIELISPKFEYAEKDAAFESMHRYTSVLKGKESSPWAALESVWAGTHVHVGLNVKEVRELTKNNISLVLRHVAYILICYEDLLTQFHPAHRSGAEPTIDETFTPASMPVLPGDTDDIRAERTLKAAIDAHTGFPELRSNARHVAMQVTAELAELAGLAELPSGSRVEWMDIRDALFYWRGLPYLVGLLQSHQGEEPHRGHLVNWSNLLNFHLKKVTRKLTKPTIEFRQHACSLSADELQHWVDLLFAIFRVAEDKAQFGCDIPKYPKDQSGACEGSKYPINDKWYRATVEEFCGPALLNLSKAEIEYWKDRYNRCQRNMPKLPWE